MTEEEPVALPLQGHAYGSHEKRVEAASASPGSEGKSKQRPESEVALPVSWGSA